MGVPVYLQNGKMYGTVCAIDPEPYAFTQDEIEVMERLSSIFAVILENATNSSCNTVDDKLMRLEKLALLGQLSAGLAHELRNPMQSVKGFVQFLFEDQVDNHFRDIVLSEIDQMDNLIHDFLLVTQPTAPKKGHYDINEVVCETVEFIQSKAALHNVEMSVSVDSDKFDVYVDRIQIKQVMINILKNAIEAVEESGKVMINVSTIGNKEVTIEVVDNGIGIPIAVIGRLGEPFFSTKEGGTGLGLSISKRIIQEHKGTISFENKKDGTKVTITLPK